jgi:hypothetical protein
VHQVGFIYKMFVTVGHFVNAMESFCFDIREEKVDGFTFDMQ